MMKESWMEVLPPVPYFAGQAGGWFMQDWRDGVGGGAWTLVENKVWEEALACVDRDAPDRWVRVATMLPGKTVADVMAHYSDLENDVCFIEAGLVPFPHYSGGGPPSSGFTLDRDGGDAAADPAAFKRSSYMAVGLSMKQSVEGSDPIVVPIDSCSAATQDDDLLEVGEKENPQREAAEVVGPRVVVHDLSVATGATVLEVDETTPSDPMFMDLIFDQLVENISSDLRSVYVRDLTSSTGSGPVKSIEKKKRKASKTDFAPARFKFKTKKTTKSFDPPVAFNQSTHQEKAPEERDVEPAPEQVAAPVPAQEPVAAPTPPMEVEVPEESQHVPTPAGNSPLRVAFSYRPRIFNDEDLDEAWGRISDRQAEASPDSIFVEYNNMAIQHLMENFAVVGGLTQRIKLLEKKNFELENSEKLKKEVIAKEAIIAKLKEECENKDRSIEYLTTRHKEVLETIEKKSEEQTQALKRTEKSLEFERGKEAAFGHNLEEKVKAFNKMLFDMGSGTQLPNLGDPMEKINFLGQQLEDLRSLLKTTRVNHAQTLFEAVKNGVSFALAKLKASDPTINLQAVEEDFSCSGDEATKFFEEMTPLGNKVAEEMEVGSPIRSDQSGDPKE